MKTNLISVIMSIYNNEFTLQKCVDSILNQTYSNIEFLITDDGSTDNSYEILKDLKNQDERIKLYKNQKNIGLTKSLNKMIKISSGDFIARQDSDDYSLPIRLETQIKMMKQLNLNISTSRAFELDTKKEMPGLSFYIPYKYLIYLKNPFIHGTLVIESSLMKRYLYNEEFIFAQDYELFSRFVKNKEVILNIKKPLYILNTKNNISNNFKIEQKEFSDKVKKSLRGF